MALQVVVYPSDLTPPTGAPYLDLVAEVLEASGATWVETSEEGDLTLSDGTEIALFHDDEDNVAYFVLEDQSEAALDLIYAVADRAEAFVSVGDRACGLARTGDVLAQHEAQLTNPEDLLTRQAFGDWMRVAIAASQPTPEPQPSRRPQRSLLQRLSDALFGKEM